MSMRDKIYLVRGELVDSEVDAIVRTATADQILGSGLAEDLKKRAGPDLVKEANEVGRLAVSQAAVTTGGKLRARHMIHCACRTKERVITEEEILEAIRNTFTEARERQVRTIAIPPLGVGGEFGFPIKRCAELLISEAIKHLEGDTTLEEVYFIVSDRSAYEFFDESIRQI